MGLADLVTPMAIRVAATLRVADHIGSGRTTAPEIAHASAVDVDALERLLRHLVSVDVLGCDASHRYSLSERGEWLREDHVSGLRSVLDIRGPLGRAELSLVQLLDSVRTGEAAFPNVYERSFWDDLSADPARTAVYDERMGSDAAVWAPHILSAYAWDSLGHIVDVGGGDASLLTALLLDAPTLRGTVFDQPRTVASARATLAAAGLDDRSDVVSGSFFDPLPTGAGGYLLCAILHDWPDEPARAILHRCREAAGPEGRVFVVEKTGADGESPSTAMDLRMLAYFGARERGVAAISALASEAGLHVAAVHPAGDLSVIELVPE